MDIPGTATQDENAPALGVRSHQPEPSALTLPEGSEALTRHLLEKAMALGCSAAGVFTVEPFGDAATRLASWLRAGHHGTMSYLELGSDRAAPLDILPPARAGLAVAMPYAPGPSPSDADLSVGYVAKYARGEDYHHRLRLILLTLADACASWVGRPVLARPCVDTAPLLEREAAARAALAFIGKNTLAIVPGVGSYVLLGELLLDVALSPGAQTAAKRRTPLAPQGCGSCTRCLDACPTGAFVGPYSLDARRCISYLTIEYAGVIPEELRAGMGAHVFGCDICQDVCPFNAAAEKHPGDVQWSLSEALAAPDLVELLELTSSGYRRKVGKTALRRVSRVRLARNAAVALGNVGDERAIAPLTRALSENKSPLVRGHAAWALGRLLERVDQSPSDPSLDSPIGDRGPPLDPRTALQRASEEDPEGWVRAEARRALSSSQRAPRKRLPIAAD